MTVAVDFVVSGISEPVRFLKELGIKVFPSNERFWNPSRPKIKEQYTLELKMVCFMMHTLFKVLHSQIPSFLFVHTTTVIATFVYRQKMIRKVRNLMKF